MAWTDEQKAAVIQQYTEAEPTPETSTEIIKQIAEASEQSPNGVRLILVQAGVYVKKDPTPAAKTTKAKTTATGDKPAAKPRVSKEDSIAALRAVIEAKGATVDDDVLSKLTGKAAIYFTEVLNA
jgi:hypothetical protein